MTETILIIFVWISGLWLFFALVSSLYLVKDFIVWHYTLKSPAASIQHHSASMEEVANRIGYTSFWWALFFVMQHMPNP